MKTKLSIVLCLGILFTACKKSTTNAGNLQIKGTWELRATRYGNIVPADYPPGNGHLLSFGNNTFFEYASDTIEARGTYKTSSNSQFQYTIYSTFSDNNATYTNTVVIQKDTLRLFSNNPDASTGFYVKTSSNPVGN